MISLGRPDKNTRQKTLMGDEWQIGCIVVTMKVLISVYHVALAAVE